MSAPFLAPLVSTVNSIDSQPINTSGTLEDWADPSYRRRRNPKRPAAGGRGNANAGLSMMNILPDISWSTTTPMAMRPPNDMPEPRFEPKDVLNPTEPIEFAPAETSHVFDGSGSVEEYRLIELSSEGSIYSINSLALLPTGEVLGIDNTHLRLVVMTAPGCWAPFVQTSASATFGAPFYQQSMPGATMNRVNMPIFSPSCLCVLADGSVLIIDNQLMQVRKVCRDGLVRDLTWETTTGTPGYPFGTFTGSGMIRTIAALRKPDQVLLVDRNCQFHRGIIKGNTIKLETIQLRHQLAQVLNSIYSVRISDTGDVYLHSIRALGMIYRGTGTLSSTSGFSGNISDFVLSKTPGQFLYIMGCNSSGYLNPTLTLARLPKPTNALSIDANLFSGSPSSDSSPSSVSSSSSTSQSPYNLTTPLHSWPDARGTTIQPMTSFAPIPSVNGLSISTDWTMLLPLPNTQSKLKSFGADRPDEGLLALPSGEVLICLSNQVYLLTKSRSKTSASVMESESPGSIKASTSNGPVGVGIGVANQPLLGMMGNQGNTSLSSREVTLLVEREDKEEFWKPSSHEEKKLNFGYLRTEYERFKPLVMSFEGLKQSPAYRVPLHLDFLSLRCPCLLSTENRRLLSALQWPSIAALSAIFTFIYDNKLIEPPKTMLGIAPPSPYASLARIRFLLELLVLSSPSYFNLPSFAQYIEFRFMNVINTIGHDLLLVETLQLIYQFSLDSIIPKISSASINWQLWQTNSMGTHASNIPGSFSPLPISHDTSLPPISQPPADPSFPLPVHRSGPTFLFDRILMLLASKSREIVTKAVPMLIKIFRTNGDLLSAILQVLTIGPCDAPAIKYVNPFTDLETELDRWIHAQAHQLLATGVTYFYLHSVPVHASILASRWPFFRDYISIEKHDTDTEGCDNGDWKIPASFQEDNALLNAFIAYLYSGNTAKFDTPQLCAALLDAVDELRLTTDTFAPLLSHCRRSSIFLSDDPLVLLQGFVLMLQTSSDARELHQARMAIARQLPIILNACPDAFAKLPEHEQYALLMLEFEEYYALEQQ